MKLRGSKPGYQSVHAAEGPSLAGIILLICLYLLGAVIGCYFASGGQSPAIQPEDWLNFCTCIDGILIAMILLLSGLRFYVALPMLSMVLQGFLTSAWVVWRCTGGTVTEYIRCCGEWVVYVTVALLCLLVSSLKGLSVKYKGGRRPQAFRISLILMGILYAFLLAAMVLQTQICKWL